jgi:hypothetical protein
MYVWGSFMITFEVHPEIYVRELRERPSFSTCSACHRSFHAKSEDQLCIGLCDHCLDGIQNHREAIISVHVRPRPQRRNSL